MSFDRERHVFCGGGTSTPPTRTEIHTRTCARACMCAGAVFPKVSFSASARALTCARFFQVFSACVQARLRASVFANVFPGISCGWSHFSCSAKRLGAPPSSSLVRSPSAHLSVCHTRPLSISFLALSCTAPFAGSAWSLTMCLSTPRFRASLFCCALSLGLPSPTRTHASRLRATKRLHSPHKRSNKAKLSDPQHPHT